MLSAYGNTWLLFIERPCLYLLLEFFTSRVVLHNIHDWEGKEMRYVNFTRPYTFCNYDVCILKVMDFCHSLDYVYACLDNHDETSSNSGLLLAVLSLVVRAPNSVAAKWVESRN